MGSLPLTFRTRALPIMPQVFHWGLNTQRAGEGKGGLEYGHVLPLLLPQPGGGHVTGLGHIGLKTSHMASAGCLGIPDKWCIQEEVLVDATCFYLDEFGKHVETLLWAKHQIQGGQNPPRERHLVGKTRK